MHYSRVLAQSVLRNIGDDHGHDCGRLGGRGANWSGGSTANHLATCSHYGHQARDQLINSLPPSSAPLLLLPSQSQWHRIFLCYQLRTAILGFSLDLAHQFNLVIRAFFRDFLSVSRFPHNYKLSPSTHIPSPPPPPPSPFLYLPYISSRS